MINPAAFRASYSDWKLIRTRKCVQLVFEVPLEESNKAYEALGGMPNSGEETWVAIARLNPKTTHGSTVDKPNDNASPASEPDKVQARARKPVDAEKRLAQRAALLCKEQQFRVFLSKEGHCVNNEESAAMAIRYLCRVDSRSEIKPGTEAGRIFDHLYSRFVAWRDADIYLEASA